MPYQYEFDKSLKIYSLTIDLDMIGRDENFDSEEASAEEKALAFTLYAFSSAL